MKLSTNALGLLLFAAAMSACAAEKPTSMVWIPGGEFWMGADDFDDAQPWHRVYVGGFWMDKTEVTNEQFEKFVKATGYVTVAERVPTKEEFPTAPPENLVAGSVVFTPPPHAVPLDSHFRWWDYVKGANWRHPTGPGRDLKGKEKHPVVHIAYDDALASCKWAGKRLPTEAEFEFAARGGLDRKTFVWGDEFKPGGKSMANTLTQPISHRKEKTMKTTGKPNLLAAPLAGQSSGQQTKPIKHMKQKLLHYGLSLLAGVALLGVTEVQAADKEYLRPLPRRLGDGPQPVQFTLGVRYYAEKPDRGPDWGLRFVVTFLFPK